MYACEAAVKVVGGPSFFACIFFSVSYQSRWLNLSIYLPWYDSTKIPISVTLGGDYDEGDASSSVQWRPWHEPVSSMGGLMLMAEQNPRRQLQVET